MNGSVSYRIKLKIDEWPDSVMLKLFDCFPFERCSNCALNIYPGCYVRLLRSEIYKTLDKAVLEYKQHYSLGV